MKRKRTRNILYAIYSPLNRVGWLGLPDFIMIIIGLNCIHVTLRNIIIGKYTGHTPQQSYAFAMTEIQLSQQTFFVSVGPFYF